MQQNKFIDDIAAWKARRTAGRTNASKIIAGSVLDMLKQIRHFVEANKIDKRKLSTAIGRTPRGFDAAMDNANMRDVVEFASFLDIEFVPPSLKFHPDGKHLASEHTCLMKVSMPVGGNIETCALHQVDMLQRRVAVAWACLGRRGEKFYDSVESALNSAQERGKIEFLHVRRGNAATVHYNDWMKLGIIAI